MTTSGDSLWYDDGDLADNVITTYDNHGAVKHYRDKVEVYVYQYGQGSTGLYTMINGERKSISAIVDTVISSYPMPFAVIHKYTIERKDVDPDEPCTIFTVGNIGITHPGASTPYTRFETNLYIYWDTEGMAEAPDVSFVFDEVSEKMVLSGANSTMEYRRKADSEWIPCTDAPMYFEGTSYDIPYLVRYAAVGDGQPSQSKDIVLPALRSKPKVTYDKSAETLSGLTSDMEVRINDGAYVDITEDSMALSDTIDAIASDATATVGVRYKATATQQASIEDVTTLYPRSEQPTTLVFDPATLTLKGGTSSMEYKTDTMDTWKSFSSSVSLQPYAQPDREAKVFARMKATNTSSASKSVEFTLPQLSTAPAGRLDYGKEAVVGLDNGEYEYSTNGKSWSDVRISNNEWNMSSLITTSAKTLYLRWAATDTNPASAAQVFDIPGRAAAPSTPAFDYSVTGQATLTGITKEMQYMKSTDSEWTNITDESGITFQIPDSSIKYYIRLKPTEQSFASAKQTVTLLKPGSVPGCSYNTTTELITALTEKMEMKIGDGTYTAVSEKTFSTSALIDSLSTGESLNIYVRTMATATAPASKDKIFTLYARSAAPSTLNYDYATNKLNGCSSSMQYRLDDEESWESIYGTKLDLQPFASAERDVIVYVRMEPTSTASASKPVEIVIPQMLPGPIGTIDYLHESIVDLINGEYEYSFNKTTWTAHAVTDGTFNVSSLLSSSTKKMYLRYAATATAPISNYTTISLAERPEAPTSPKFVYNDPDYPDQVVLTGLTADMQYQQNDSEEWLDVTEEQIVFDVPNSSTAYYVRTKSTTDSWASLNARLTLARRSSAPSCTYDESKELISGVKSTMEISIGGEAYTPIKSGTTYDVSDLVDNLSGDETIEIKIRVKATATAPASKEKILIIGARTKEADNLEFDTPKVDTLESYV